jgi:hypothetical protein
MFFDRKVERILRWRDFRNELSDWPDDIHAVAKIWSLAPRAGNYLAYDDITKWPDAWNLIHEGIFCDISVALGLFYTLYYSNYPHKNKMRIEHYHMPSKHQTLNLVSLEDGKYMLNYHCDRSVNIHEIEALPIPTYIVTAKELPIKN